MEPGAPYDPYRWPTELPPSPRTPRTWAWIVAGVLWALFSVAAVAVVAAIVVGRSDPGAPLPARAAPSPPGSAEAVPSATPVPPTASGGPLPSVAVTGTDPRPAAAAAWNAANTAYGTSDLTHFCPMYAFGPDYIYTDLQQCISAYQPQIATFSLGERKEAGEARIAASAMVMLADGSLAFRESDKTWPTHPDWHYDDTSVIVMRDVPGQGWRVVGYYDGAASNPMGSVPVGVR